MKLTNNLDLSNETTYQNIYSSQLYGTFFMIFAKFQTETCEDGYKIKSIVLRLLNYKGPVNLGIKRAKLVPVIDAGTELRVLKIELQALAQSNCDFEVDMDEELECKLQGYIKVFRWLKPLESDFVNYVFDNEFRFREGFKKTRDGMKPHSKPRKPEPANDYDIELKKDDVSDEKGGWICPRSTNKIIK